MRTRARPRQRARAPRASGRASRALARRRRGKSERLRGSLPLSLRYEVTHEAGELLYVPTWFWHRVDYPPNGEASATLSLFHVRPGQMLANNALYSAVLLPNLLKEMVGWKTQ